MESVNTIQEGEEMSNHGGKRPGSGRKSGEPSKQVRVPVSLVPAVEALKRLRKTGPDAVALAEQLCSKVGACMGV